MKLRSIFPKVCEVLRRRKHGDPVPNGLWKMLEIPCHKPSSCHVGQSEEGQILWIRAWPKSQGLEGAGSPQSGIPTNGEEIRSGGTLCVGLPPYTR
jgi:hypothetical protein